MFAQRSLADDPTAPLRRFPITVEVRRPDLGDEPISILRLNALHPKDEVLVSVDDRLKGDWTLVAATVGAGQKIRVKSWNLWDKKVTRNAINTGALPDSDVVPLYFLVLNKRREHRVFDGIRHALETSSQDIVSQTAIFQSIYKQQNRLLNFMTAYAALGPKSCPDPKSLNFRVAEINSDLGASYDPTAQTTSPGQLQHGLDAGVAVLGAFRQSPDNPAPAAQAARSQLPSVVSDWIGLVGDLMHVFIKPPRDIKLMFVPASAVEPDPSLTKGSFPFQLVTERVLETSDDSLPSLVYRPPFERQESLKPFQLAVARTEILASSQEVSIPLGPECRDLFQHPWAWDWESSIDGSAFSPIGGAHLVPGRGVVFPITSSWWASGNSHTLYLRARIGFQRLESRAITVARVMPQHWSLEALTSSECASGDPSVAIRLSRTGQDQPFYRFVSVFLKDSAGRTFSAEDVPNGSSISARFNLSAVSPGGAQIFVQQEDADGPDQPVSVFIAPKHPNVSIFCGKGDRVLRISGPEANWVKSVQVPSLFVQETDDSEPGNRKLTLSAPLPGAIHTVDVTYRDPQRGLEWTHSEPISVGQPRPRVNAAIVGVVPTSLPIGSGADPSWATATLPAGWVRTKQPLRIQMSAIQPFAWTHDIALEVGFGSAGDVQSVLNLPEGPNFSLDSSNPDAYLTLDLDTMLLPNSKRNSGLLWVRLSRTDLASPWTLVTVKSDSGSVPIRAVKLPTVQSVQSSTAGIKILLSNAEQVLGAKFQGQSGVVPLQLQDSAPGNLAGIIEGPANATEFDIEMRDSSDGTIHVKLSKGTS